MKAFTTLVVLLFCGFASAREDTQPKLSVDECTPKPVCHQCLTGVFPADLCCRDVETYHNLRLADGNDCSSYYQCVNGHSVHRQCPAGLHWSVDSDRCEHPAVAKCGNGGSNGEDDDKIVDDNNLDKVKGGSESIENNEEDHSGSDESDESRKNNKSSGSDSNETKEAK